MAESGGWTPYSTRMEWKDISPVPQDDGPKPVVAIQYSPEATDVMNYFRAVVQANEKSERALALTADAIQVNAANYTAWHYRRLCLEALGSDLKAEMEFVESVAKENPKNYQIWNHRRLLVSMLGDATRELDFTAEILDGDAKNYHAWSHRQWVVLEFKLWDGELAFVDELLEDDVRNNSAWNHRWFVLANTTPMNVETRKAEIEYTFKHIRTAPRNASGWNYLRGLLRGQNYKDYPEVREHMVKLHEDGLAEHSEAVGFRAHSLFQQAANRASMLQVVELTERLVTLDPIRHKYWKRLGDAAKVKAETLA